MWNVSESLRFFWSPNLWPRSLLVIMLERRKLRHSALTWKHEQGDGDLLLMAALSVTVRWIQLR